MKYTAISSLLLVIVATVSASTKPQLIETDLQEKNDIADFVEGFFKGFTAQEVQNLNTCINNTEEIFKSLKYSSENFRKDPFVDIFYGLSELSKAIKMIPSALSNCDNISSNTSKIIDYAELFVHPLTIVYNPNKTLILNGADIYGNIQQSLNSRYYDEFYDYG